jgi:hypothetical protein
MEIRAEFRRLLKEELRRSPMLFNKAVFYCGVLDSSLKRFLEYLAKDRAYRGAKNLELLDAGKFLERTIPELRNILPADYDVRRTFYLPGGLTFHASINSFWRELSARYARLCSGIVHVLVGHERTKFHHKGLEYWAKNGRRDPTTLKALKVWGFVEFPILIGAIADNAGVTAVKVYVEPSPGVFTLLGDSPYVIANRGCP